MTRWYHWPFERLAVVWCCSWRNLFFLLKRMKRPFFSLIVCSIVHLLIDMSYQMCNKLSVEVQMDTVCCPFSSFVDHFANTFWWWMNLFAFYPIIFHSEWVFTKKIIFHRKVIGFKVLVIWMTAFWPMAAFSLWFHNFLASILCLRKNIKSVR